MVPVQALGFELPKLVALSVLCIGCALAIVFGKRDVITPLTESNYGRWYLGFGAAILLSVFWSVAPITSIIGASPRFQGILTHLLYLLLGVFVAERMHSTRGRSVVVSAIICANIFVVFYGVLQMMHMDPMASIWKLEAFLGRIFSSVGHPNTLGQFIILTVPFVGLQWILHSERITRMAWGILLICNAVVLLGTVSRSAMLGAFVLLLFGIPALRRWMKSRVNNINTEQAFALSLMVVLCTSIGLLFFAQRFSLTFESGRSVSSREVMWSSTVSQIKERPIGWGLETMAFTSPQFTGKELYNYESLTTTVDRAHNELLHLLLTLGPLGLITYTALVVSLLLGVLRYRKEDKYGLLHAAGAGILAYQVAVFFGFPSIATAAFFWILTGMLIGLLPKTRSPMRVRGIRIINFCLLALATVVFVVSVRWTQSRWISAYAQSITYTNPSLSLSWYQQAVLMFRFDRQTILDATQVHLIALEQDEIERREDLVASTHILIGLMRTATNHHDGMADLLDAWLAAIEGDSARAEASLALAKVFLPTSVVYHRTALHIADILEDGVMAQQHKMGIRSLLPDGYFEEGSEIRRILIKQHPWLQKL
jgi:O-antigen ligase